MQKLLLKNKLQKIMENYKLQLIAITGDLSKYARRLSDGALVHREKNEEYLAWLSEGNTPEPADPIIE